MIPALGVNEPYASAMVHGIKTWETRGQPPNGEMRPDGVTGFPGVRLPRGGRVMVIANAGPPSSKPFGGWLRHEVHDDRWSYHAEGLPWRDGSASRYGMLILHPGCIVGSVTVTDALPIVDGFGSQDDRLPKITNHVDYGHGLKHMQFGVFPSTDISDQLPWGDWRAGRWAWQLADPKTTNEMCPVCEGDSVITNLDDPWPGTDSFRTVPCPVCHGEGGCDPIPVRGHQGLRPLKPEQFL